MNLKIKIKKSKNRKSRKSEIQISKRDADKNSKNGSPLKGATKITNRSSKVRTEGLSRALPSVVQSADMTIKHKW